MMWHFKCSVLCLTLQAPGKLTAARRGASVPWEGLRRGPVPAAVLSPAHAEWFLTLTSGSGGFFFIILGWFLSFKPREKSTDPNKAKEPLAR